MLSATVRALETDAEIDAFYALAIQAFSEVEDVEGAARAYRISHETSPDFHPGQRRGVVAGNTLLGGYLMLERWLLMGPARIRTACIGSVVTAPEHRMAGVATAMMQDAEAHARYRGHALLLLNGIPNFYARLGYVDVFDRVRHVIQCTSIPGGEDLPVVRPATVEDAPALLALYRRHYREYRSSFVRTLEHQRHHLRFQIDRGIAPLVVEHQGGALDGYLIPTTGPDNSHAREVAANTWPATLALLHAHMAQTEEADALWWPLPIDSPTFFLLADNLPMTDRRNGESLLYPVRTEITIDPRAGWMAHAGHLSLLIHQLAPYWGHCWSQRGPSHATTFTLIVDDAPYSLRLDGDTVRVTEEAFSDGPAALLSSGVFTQLAFGYRPVQWAAGQPEQHIPDPMFEPLEILFPPGGTWIPGSDFF